MRVHELAKELHIDSKELMGILKEMDVEVKTHMSSITDAQAAAVRARSTGSAAASAGEVREPAEAETLQAEKEIVDRTVSESDGSATVERVVEKRLSRTVIRRRKKVTVEPPPEPPDITAGEEVPASEPVEAPPEPVEPVAPPPETPAAAEAEPEATAAADVSPEAGEADAPAAPEPIAVEEEGAPVVQVKKLQLRHKESSPAKIITRIDLGPKKTPAPAGEAANADVPPAERLSREAPRPEAPSDKEKEDRARARQKDKAKRKKFQWKQEVSGEDDSAEQQRPLRHKRIRYKVSDRPTGKGRRHKADIVPLFQKETEKTVPKASKRKIRVQEGITVAELAKRMSVKAGELIKKLIELGVMATMNQFIDVDTAALVAADFGFEIESVSIEEEAIFEEQAEDAGEHLVPRAPVVTVMGHVDHGKTSLLDAIRESNVVAGEQGGITQHIGAYRVSTPHGEIAFVDTPGHEAFTAMRARGAQVTDLVILVVAAEEGVKPQTIEAINHARAAEVPIVVAVNKIDKPEANPERVRQELSQYGLLSEQWGGDTIFVEVSAKNRLNIDKLLEMVLLQSEMLELRANPEKPAKGTIVEARLDRGRGSLATVLIQEGTLRIGDSFVSRQSYGKVRAMFDHRGDMLTEAGPSTPVEVLGFSDVPEAGDVFLAVDEKKARQTSDYWQQKKRREELRKDSRVTLENFLSRMGQEETKQLSVIVKADVQGSSEALQQSLENLGTDEVQVGVIHASVGAISLNDVMLAAASSAIIIGFNVKAEPKVYEAAEDEGVDIRNYGVIYEVLDDVKKAMVGMLEPKYAENTEGRAEIRQVFHISKTGAVAGCYVIEGRIGNGSKARLIRGGEIVHEGQITSLKHFKEDAREVQAGQECGIFLGTYQDFQEGDVIESFSLKEVERTL